MKEISKSAQIIRDFQEINYPILWDGHLVCPKLDANGETPTPQKIVSLFLFMSTLSVFCGWANSAIRAAWRKPSATTSQIQRF